MKVLAISSLIMVGGAFAALGSLSASSPVNTVKVTGSQMTVSIENVVTQDVIESVQEGLSFLGDPEVVKSIKSTPVDGIFEVVLIDNKVLYTDQNVAHIFDGTLLEVQQDGLVNLTEGVMNDSRKEAMASVSRDDQIIFSPEGEVKASVTVFTDIDCGYCQKLHSEMAGYNEQGIEIRYMAYPRAGVGSESYKKIVTAWCSDDQKLAMTNLKARVPMTPVTCENPVAQQFAISQEIGLRGTPAIITDDGVLISGYRPPANLAQALGI